MTKLARTNNLALSKPFQEIYLPVKNLPDIYPNS